MAHQVVKLVGTYPMDDQGVAMSKPFQGTVNIDNDPDPAREGPADPATREKGRVR
jgi:hypothetical protein